MGAPEDIRLDDVDLDRVPAHVSIIMDGNGRWATARGLDRSQGHVAGVDSLREAVTTSVRLGLDVPLGLRLLHGELAAPARGRPPHAPLCHDACERAAALPSGERPPALPGDIAPCPSARAGSSRSGLTRPPTTPAWCSRSPSTTARGQRCACRPPEAAERVAAGSSLPDEVDRDGVSGSLYTAGLPDPDLLIGTSGELRLSNYLLWQLAYTEFYVTDPSGPTSRVGTSCAYRVLPATLEALWGCCLLMTRRRTPGRRARPVGTGLDRPIDLLENRRASREDKRAAGDLTGQKARSSAERLTRTTSVPSTPSSPSSASSWARSRPRSSSPPRRGCVAPSSFPHLSHGRAHA